MTNKLGVLFWSIKEFEEALDRSNLTEEEKTLERLRMDDYLIKVTITQQKIRAQYRSLPDPQTVEYQTEEVQPSIDEDWVDVVKLNNFTTIKENN